MENIQTIEQALSHIPSDDREIWIECGMAIKAEVGDTGFDAWDRWSANADSYNAKTTTSCWKSFKASGKVSIGTLFHHAKSHGYQHNGSSKPTSPTVQEITACQVKRKAADDLLAHKRKKAAAQADTIWNTPITAMEDTPISEHPYLVHKKIQTHGAKVYCGSLVIGGMNCNGALMLPLILNGKITSLQFIGKDGEKRFLTDGEKGGYLIGRIVADIPVCICEGFATGASIYEATGYPVIVSFDAGNMKKMALALRKKKPDAEIRLCADADETGTGQRKAKEAALAVNGLVAMPEFNADKSADDKDFNDMANTQGYEAVARAIAGAMVAATETPPEPLPTLPNVLLFDYSYLPDTLRGYVRDISERMQCPPDFAAVGVLVMIATIIGRKIGIRPMKHNDWTVIPNLWGAVVGNSGVMKSPTLAATLSPIKKLQAVAYDVFNKEMIEWQKNVELALLQKSVNKSEAKKSLKNGSSADAKELVSESCEQKIPPILKRYITNNASYEALGELLMENPNGLMVESDEIIGLLKQLDAGGQEVARSFYLTAADGDKSYTFDRIMRGKGLHIPALCLSIIGGIQPGVLAEYVRQATTGGAGADGLLQRFGLMVYPDISPNWKEVDRYPDSEAKKAVNELAKYLDNLNTLMDISTELDDFNNVPFMRFDADAQILFSEWRANLELRLRSGEEHPAIISHLSKYRKLIPSLALINYLCDYGKNAVNEKSLLRAIAYSEYLESHARRIYASATRPDIDSAKTILNKLDSGKLSAPFKARDIYIKGWTGLDTSQKAQSAINLLIEYSHLTVEEVITGGRPTAFYHLNKGATL